MSGGQINLFSLLIDPAVPYVAGSKTSKDAADAKRSTVQRDRDRLLAWLRAFGPATDEQMQAALDMDGSTQRPRRGELQRDGLVYDTGKTALTKSGRAAVLWGATRR